MIGFQISSQQKALVAFVEDLVRTKIKPLALEMDSRGDESFDWRLLDVLAQHNLIAPEIPEQYGGRGLDYLTTAMIIEEIAFGCAGLAACMIGTMHAITPIILGGTEKQKQTYLPLLVDSHPNLASFASTEPSGGSDLGKLGTIAVYQDGEYVLNGCKDYIINGAVANFSMVCANLNPERGRTGLQFFIVPSELIKVNKVRNKMGLRYANTSQLVFENVTLPEECIVGEERSGYLLMNQTLDYGRAIVGAMHIGIARAAYENALHYTRERQQFGKPIIANQGVSFPLVEMATAIEAARFMVWKASWLIDQDEVNTKEASMAKIMASQVAEQITSQALNLMGAIGYTSTCLANVYFRDAKAGLAVAGTNNILKEIVASLL